MEIEEFIFGDNLLKIIIRALTVAMIRSCFATSKSDRNRSPRQNPRVCSNRV